jgi:hypothetical protein
MTSRSEATLPARRWAPWWIYVLAIAPANLGKEQVLGEADWWLRTALTATIVLGGIALVTALYRGQRP